MSRSSGTAGAAGRCGPRGTVTLRASGRCWRKAGRQEFSDDHGGFAVEGGDGGDPFMVACADDAGASAVELPQYEAALRAAGYRVEPEPGDDQALRAWPPPP
jgi:hypothetical protein